MKHNLNYNLEDNQEDNLEGNLEDNLEDNSRYHLKHNLNQYSDNTLDENSENLYGGSENLYGSSEGLHGSSEGSFGSSEGLSGNSEGRSDNSKHGSKHHSAHNSKLHSKHHFKSLMDFVRGKGHDDEPFVPNEYSASSSKGSKTIYFRIFTYFAVFTIIIMITLWLLQIIFLQTFYQVMKTRELYNVAETIEENVADESLYNIISQLTVKSDMYIQIEVGDAYSSSKILYSTERVSPSDKMLHFAERYNTLGLKAQLDGDVDHVVTKQVISPGNTEAMIYASILSEGSDGGDNVYLIIYTPLTPVGTTINILAKILIQITVLSIIIGLVMSIFISRRLARPLYSITLSAAKLAEGHYDTHFDGRGYAETEELAATLNYAASELSKSDKLQKDLVANVSHDLKTPLTMVKSYAEMIRDISGDNPEKRDRHLQVIINEADRLNLLVNDLTALSKMQAGVDALNCDNFDIKTAAQRVLDSFSLHVEQNNFNLSVESEGSTIVYADKKKINQVFANLVGNAIRYSSDDKYVCIRLKEMPDCVRCEVIDHGQGICKEDLESIWDRYYQSSKNHSRTTSGSGLGLSIVKQVFVLHEARYGVESEEGSGSTFWFELSKGKEMTEAQEESEGSEAHEAQDAAAETPEAYDTRTSKKYWESETVDSSEPREAQDS